MSNSLSKPKRRAVVFINYLFLMLVIILFSLGKYYFRGSLPILIGLGASLIVTIATFFILHIKTKLWSLTHADPDQLDEREVAANLVSIKQAFVIFTIISIAIVFTIAIMAGKHDSTIMLINASLIYLAHTLPSSILAWKEREV